MTERLDPDDFIVEWLDAHSGVFFRRGETLESVQTQYQHLEVLATPALGRMFRLDGANMTSEKDEFFYHENIVHPGMLAQLTPRSALVVGGGDGGAVEEILKHPSIARVVVAELDADVVRAARTWLPSVHRGSIDDGRVEIRLGDALGFVGATTERFDVVIMDLTDPVGPSEALYTAAFYRSLARIMTADATVALHLGSPFFQPRRFASTVRQLQEVFGIVRPYFVYIPLYGANWGMACAAQRTDPVLLSSKDCDARIAARGIGDLRYFNGDMHRAGFALPNYVRELLAPASSS